MAKLLIFVLNKIITEMKIEFRNSGKKNARGYEIWHLFIDNKTDKFKYDEEGMAIFIVPETERLRHLKKLRTIPCRDLSEDIKLWNIINIDAPPGQISTFEISREGRRIKTYLKFSFKEGRTEGYKKYFLNPLRLNDKMIKNSKKKGVHVEYMGNEAPVDDLVFEFEYDLNGTVGDRLDDGCRIIFKIAEESERQNMAEVRNFLKTRGRS